MNIYPWLEQNMAQLVQLHTSKRLPHAILLQGVSGTGKAEFAQMLAWYLLCKTPINNKACLSCKSCELNKAGTHPDLYHLEPEEIGKQLKVEQIRNLNDFIYTTAQQGGYRVVIIDPTDAMNTSSSNALLKMLEEPGERTILLLITAKPGQILPTIKSRCQKIICNIPNEVDAINWLMSQAELDKKQATYILRINQGAPKRAIAYIEQGYKEQRMELIRGLTDILKQRRSPFEVAASLQKMDIELLLDWLHSLLTDAVRAAVCMSDAVLCQQDARNMLAAVAKKTNAVKIINLAEKVYLERKNIMLRQNPNKQLLLESVLLEWANLPN